MVSVTEYKIIGPYTLRLAFDDGEQTTINFESVLHGFYYAPLRDLNLFNQVRVDPEARTLVWPNGADFDPATLHDWHKGDGIELSKRAAHWRDPEPVK